MKNTDGLYILNYCHHNCTPLKNIMRLTKEEAFALAHAMAANNADTTAFYRFADFQNYYPLRLEVDRILYNTFISLGGNPKTEHPLSFVLQGSDYLDRWFDNGNITKIQLKSIPSEYISFTYGDSCAVLKRSGNITLITKEMLLDSICKFEGTIDDYMKEITQKHYYIEVQLWNDDYCTV
jgi:hypothetical protein